jgi:predicted ABC-type transport system involved in lysophospholipase L1 biosynthesis ATPase subunit
MSLLSFEDVRKSVRDGSRDVPVLDGVSLEVSDGDFLGVWGPRGSGKSTLLRIAAGLSAPEAGRVLVDGHDVAGLSADARARALRGVVGFVGSPWQAHRNRTAVEHVALAASAAGTTTGKQARSAARRALHRVEAAECADRPLDGLALGERVRVELARALARSPRLLVIDEPPVPYSPGEGEDLHALLVSLGRDRDLAVLLASGDLGLVGEADRVTTFSRGRLRETRRGGEIIAFPDRRAGAGR